MTQSTIQSLEVSYLLQATEDEEKVRRAVSDLMGDGAGGTTGGGDLQVERQIAAGHYGNEIVWLRHHFTGDVAEATLQQIVSHLGADEKRAILANLDEMLDEHRALYIRLSKQVLVMKGDAVLGTSDPIRIKVKPRSSLVKDDPAGFYSRLFARGGGG